jgi:hypothetical protein
LLPALFAAPVEAVFKAFPPRFTAGYGDDCNGLAGYIGIQGFTPALSVRLLVSLGNFSADFFLVFHV